MGEVDESGEPKPPRWVQVLIFPLVMIAPLVLMLTSPGCKDPIATIPAELDRPSEVSVDVPGDTRLAFPVSFSSVSHNDSAMVLLDVTLLSGGKAVGALRCEGFELEGAGCSGHVTHYNSDCSTTTPPGGIDAVRVLPTLSKQGLKVSYEGFKIKVVRP